MPIPIRQTPTPEQLQAIRSVGAIFQEMADMITAAFQQAMLDPEQRDRLQQVAAALKAIRDRTAPIKVHQHLWPEPICDRPPTAEDGDHQGMVQYLNHEGRWASGAWYNVANNFGECPWLHCPQWRMDWSDPHTLARVVPLVPAPIPHA
jgi:hypothetical protein